MAEKGVPEQDFFANDTPHGYVKRFMWKRYLQSFVAKTQQKEKYHTLIYDGFAGAGVYSDEWHDDIAKYGSPLIALRVSINYFIKNNQNCKGLRFEPTQDDNEQFVADNQSLQIKNCMIQVYLVEKDETNFKKLAKNVGLMFRSYKIPFIRRPHSSCSSKYIEIISEDVNVSLGCCLKCDDFEKVGPPAMVDKDRLVALIDPFGYTQIPMSHVQKFVGSGKEVFINFMSKFVNRFFDVQGEQMQNLFGLNKRELESRLSHTRHNSDSFENRISLYKDILKEKSDKTSYALSFLMKCISNARLYHMIFISCHEKGFEAMKEAMNTCSQDPREFLLSDFLILKKGHQMNLQNGQVDTDVADVIFQNFKGKVSVSIKTVREFVLYETIFVWRKRPLKVLCDNGKIEKVVNNDNKSPNIRGTFPDTDCMKQPIEWYLTFIDGDVENLENGVQKLHM